MAGIARWLAIAFVLANGCGQPKAGDRSQDRALPPAPAGVTSPAQGSVTEGKVSPSTDTGSAAPELTREERERLIEGTMKTIPDPSSPRQPAPRFPVR
jgi:hypothetical protein